MLFIEPALSPIPERCGKFLLISLVKFLQIYCSRSLDEDESERSISRNGIIEFQDSNAMDEDADVEESSPKKRPRQPNQPALGSWMAYEDEFVFRAFHGLQERDPLKTPMVVFFSLCGSDLSLLASMASPQLSPAKRLQGKNM